MKHPNPQKKGLMWRNCKINLNHDYAPFILARQRESTEAWRALKKIYKVPDPVSGAAENLQYGGGGNVGIQTR